MLHFILLAGVIGFLIILVREIELGLKEDRKERDFWNSKVGKDVVDAAKRGTLFKNV